MPAFRPSFSLEREGSEERRDLNWRGGGKEGVLPAIRDALLLNRTKKKRKRRVRWVSGENLWRIFMEMQILFSPMNALRKRKMHAKDGNLPFSDRDPFNSANKTSLLCNYVVSPEGSVTVSINLSLTFQPYLSYVSEWKLCDKGKTKELIRYTCVKKNWIFRRKFSYED